MSGLYARSRNISKDRGSQLRKATSAAVAVESRDIDGGKDNMGTPSVL